MCVLAVELYDAVIDAIRLDNSTRRMLKLKKLLHELPEQNFETFHFLAQHLSRVASQEEVNKVGWRFDSGSGRNSRNRVIGIKVLSMFRQIKWDCLVKVDGSGQDWLSYEIKLGQGRWNLILVNWTGQVY